MISERGHQGYVVGPARFGGVMPPKTIVTLDCEDPLRLGGFWLAALGYESLEGDGEPLAWLSPPAGSPSPPVYLQAVPEPKSVKNPMQTWDEESTADPIGNYAATPAGAGKVFQFLFDQSKEVATYGTNPLWRVVGGPWVIDSYEPVSLKAEFTANKSYSGPEKPHLSHYVLDVFQTAGVNIEIHPQSENTLYAVGGVCPPGPCGWGMLVFAEWIWNYGEPAILPTDSAQFGKGNYFGGGYYSPEAQALITTAHSQTGLSHVFAIENYLSRNMSALWFPTGDNQISVIKDTLHGWSPQNPFGNPRPSRWYFSS